MIQKEIRIREWVSLIEKKGYTYSAYLKSILSELNKDEFAMLKATNLQEKELGLLSDSQIEELREALRQSFKKNLRLSQTEKLIKEIGLKDRYIMENGEKVLALSKEERPISIARTETTRLANNGALRNFKDNQVKEVRFLASYGDRTCPICQALDGKTYELNESFGIIPVHPSCRCAWFPI